MESALKVIIFSLIAVSLISCNKRNTVKEINYPEHAQIFEKLQNYVNQNYSGWRLSGIRSGQIETTDNNKYSNSYSLLLENDKGLVANTTSQKLIFVVVADFNDFDGKAVTYIFEPSPQLLNDKVNGKLKNESEINK